MEVPVIRSRYSGNPPAVVCFAILPRGIGKTGREARESASQISFVDAIRGLVRIRSFWILAIAGVLTAIGAWIFINWLPLYFRENFGMTLTSAGFFGSSLVSVTAAVSQVAGGAVSDVLAKKGLASPPTDASGAHLVLRADARLFLWLRRTGLRSCSPWSSTRHFATPAI